MKRDEYETAQFYVGGMACAFCATTIEKGLRSIIGVISVKVILESGEVFVRYNNNLVSKEFLRKEIEKLGYYVFEKDYNSKNVLRDSKNRALISWSLTFLSFLISLPFMMRKPLSLPFLFYLEILIATINLFYVALPIHLGAFNALKKKILNEHVLYGVAGFSGYALGLLGFLESSLIPFLFISSLLTSLHLTAGWMGAYLRDKAEKALKRLVDLRPPIVHMVNGRNVPLSQVKKGDKIIIKPGEKIPLDGIVIKGESEVSEAIITGESEPVLKRVGDYVIGGSTNGNGLLIVEVTADYNQGYLSRILGLVRRSKEMKSRTLTFFEHIVDKIWVPLVLLISLLTLIAWSVYGIIINRPDLWITGAINTLLVMIIGYPCAIGFTMPSVGLTLFSHYLNDGILIKDINVFEKLREINTVILDKTGTLTYGMPKVKGIYGGKEVLVFAASLERFSSHPIAKAIIEYAEKINADLLDVENISEKPGKGIEGFINGKKVFIGKIDENLNEKWNDKLKGNIIVCVDNEIIGTLEIEDEIRDDAKSFVNELRKLGINNIIMVTGDKEEKAKKVADALGINIYFSNVPPEEKVKLVEKYKKEGRVMMIGDGVNDAAALALSDVSIATSNSIDLSKHSADIVMITDNFHNLVKLVKQSKNATYALRSNILLALAFNAIGIPLAIWGLLNDLGAMTIMVTSLLGVFINALLAPKYLR